MKFTAVTAAMVLAGSAEAFWRMECRGRSGLARIDPLVNPGVAAAHAHTIFGSSGMFISSCFVGLILSLAVPVGIRSSWLVNRKT